MTELTGKGRRSVIVRPMRQCQVVLRIEKINVLHHRPQAIINAFSCIWTKGDDLGAIVGVDDAGEVVADAHTLGIGQEA